MTSIVRYLSHPNVEIDPNRQPQEWGLNGEGRMRAAALALKSWPNGTVHIVSSAERKAIETATPIATAFGLTPEIRSDMHENDRSAAGFLQRQEFEETANRVFARPDISIRGWETAKAAQTRIVSATMAVLETSPPGDLLIVDHGAVGTLLICHFGNHPINRAHDQPQTGGGNVFAFHRDDLKLLHGWMPPEGAF
ncbi:MAG: histidine phosphatase family protein [Paracoccaceae bacterium]